METYFDDEGSTDSFSADNDDENVDAVEKEPVEKLSNQQSKRVNRWRLVVLLLILAACAVASVTIYFYIRDEEKKDSVESVSAWNALILSEAVCVEVFSRKAF